jgi:hypothetical protein
MRAEKRAAGQDENVPAKSSPKRFQVMGVKVRMLSCEIHLANDGGAAKGMLVRLDCIRFGGVGQDNENENKKGGAHSVNYSNRSASRLSRAVLRCRRSRIERAELRAGFVAERVFDTH